jgi:hypothetical protein
VPPFTTSQPELSDWCALSGCDRCHPTAHMTGGAHQSASPSSQQKVIHCRRRFMKIQRELRRQSCRTSRHCVVSPGDLLTAALAPSAAPPRTMIEGRKLQ